MSTIITGDQATGQLLALGLRSGPRPGGGDRGGPEWTVRWRWSPQSDLADLVPADSWQLVSEVKPRWYRGKRLLLTCASGGLAAVVAFPGGRVLWATRLPDLNPHSLEVLPGGHIAVAASSPGTVRLYPASTSPRGVACTAFALHGAHGVCWDDARQVLWALGAEHLLALRPTGDRRSPALTEQLRLPLAVPGGHDLEHVARHPGRLWVTGEAGVRQFDTRRLAFLPPPDPDLAHLSSVKSVGDDPATGQILTTRPEPGNPEPWDTATLRLHRPTGLVHLPGSAVYKARWLPWLPW
ncbi:DUF6528 family protein [Kitasatospora sp. NPDC056138]|uniref:DUF6528 family protein n=1 Tax=Kitasatospora sp. NPDC056138 TaxID=3345724 RepID=UPI0035DD90F0